MAVKRGALEFQNVVSMKTRCPYGKWEEEAQRLRTFLVRNDFFITGPVLLNWENIDEDTKEADLTISLPLYQEMQLPENDTFTFQKRFLCEDGLKIRHASLEDDMKVTERILQTISGKAGLQLQEPYYYIYLPVFQEYIVDIYAKVIEGEAQ